MTIPITEYVMIMLEYAVSVRFSFKEFKRLFFYYNIFRTVISLTFLTLCLQKKTLIQIVAIEQVYCFLIFNVF